MRTAPTKKQKAVYDFMLARLLEDHAQPSIREIGLHMGISSPNGIASHLAALTKKGWLGKRGGKSARCYHFAGIKLRKEPCSNA